VEFEGFEEAKNILIFSLDEAKKAERGYFLHLRGLIAHEVLQTSPPGETNILQKWQSFFPP
jgi:hypothetical protein